MGRAERPDRHAWRGRVLGRTSSCAWAGGTRRMCGMGPSRPLGVAAAVLVAVCLHGVAVPGGASASRAGDDGARCACAERARAGARRGSGFAPRTAGFVSTSLSTRARARAPGRWSSCTSAGSSAARRWCLMVEARWSSGRGCGTGTGQTSWSSGQPVQRGERAARTRRFESPPVARVGRCRLDTLRSSRNLARPRRAPPERGLRTRAPRPAGRPGRRWRVRS